MLRDTDGGSPWLYTGLGGSITYNPDNNTNKTAMIGTTSVPSNAGKARFYVESPSTEPQIALGTSGSSNVMNVTSKNYGIRISESKSGDVSVNSVGIGYKSEASGISATALGDHARAREDWAIAVGSYANSTNSYAIALDQFANATNIFATALGRSANASGTYSAALSYLSKTSGSYSTALGYNSNATQSYATALGASSSATHSYSTAVGYGATTSASNQIVFGSSSTTVYIPGNLVVGRNALLNAQRGDTALRRGNGGELCVVRSEDLKGGDDNLRRYPTDIDDRSFFDSYISDRRLKNVGEVFSGGLDKVKQLKVYNFTFKDDESKTPHVGVMAQDLQKVFPDAVTKGKDGFLRIRWEDMFYALVNAVKELDLKVTTENKELKKRVTELEKQNKQLEERLSKLEKKIL